jgi:hypothetical protein
MSAIEIIARAEAVGCPKGHNESGRRQKGLHQLSKI